MAGRSLLVLASTAARTARLAAMEAVQQFAAPQAALVPALAGVPVPAAPARATDDAPAWLDAVWNMAVPKSKKSHSRKRMRQMNPRNDEKLINHYYPCPGCKEGWLKLRHHLCVCKLRELGYRPNKEGVVRYGKFRNVME